MNDVNFTFGMTDQGAKSTISGIKQEAGGLQRTLKEIGQSIGKAGGVFGGLAGRALGGAGGPFAPLAIAAVAATFAINAMNAASDRAVKIAQDEVQWHQKVAQAIDTGNRARRATAAGGLSQANDTRKLLLRGGSIDIARGLKNDGIELGDAIKGEADLALENDPDKRRRIRSGARELAQTGEISYADAVKNLSKQPGQFDLRRILTRIRGLMPTDDNLLNAGTTLSRVEGFGQDDDSGMRDQVKQAIVNGQTVGVAQSEDLTSGRTANAIRDQAAEILDPVAKAMSDLQQQVDNTAAVMKAGADAQFKLSRMLAEAGRALGMSGGSGYQELNDYTRGSKVVGE